MARAGYARVGRQTLKQWRAARRRVLAAGATRGAVHELRMRTRRLVALEALLAPTGSARRPGSVERELHEAFHASGRLRDAQLAARASRQLSPSLPAAARLARHEDRRLPRLGASLQRELRAVRGRKLEAIVGSWLQPARGDAQQVLAQRALRRLGAESRWLQGAGRGAASTGAHRLHRRRIHVKRLRYMAELVRAAGQQLPRGMHLPGLALLQQGLGTITDLDMELRLLARFGAAHPRRRAAVRVLRGQLLLRRAAAVRQLGIDTYSSRRAAGA